jgi:alpha-2-macroglobulin
MLLRRPLAMAQLGAALASYGDQPRADAMFRPAPPPCRWRRAGGRNRSSAPIWHPNPRCGGGAGAGAEAGSRWWTARRWPRLGPRRCRCPRRRRHGSCWPPMRWSVAGGRGLMLDGAPAARPAGAGSGCAGLTSSRVTNSAPATLTLTALRRADRTRTRRAATAMPSRAAITRWMGARPPASIKAGTRLVRCWRSRPLASGEARLMVSDPLPAGSRSTTPTCTARGRYRAGLAGAGPNVTHTEFRQDRFLPRWTGAATRRSGWPISCARCPGQLPPPGSVGRGHVSPRLPRADRRAGRVTVTE